MRITVLLSILTLLVLSGCTTARPIARSEKVTPDLSVAEHICLNKGYTHGTFEYTECYDNRPEVQAYARNARFSNLAIINENRSTRVTTGRSYPVE